MTVNEALSTLERFPKKGALFLHRLISSAVANAEHNAAQKRDSLHIKEIIVNKGPAFRRFQPIARGRARPIDKWTSHISVELGVVVPEGQREKPTKQKSKGKGEKQEKKAEKKEELQGEYSESKPQESFHQKQDESVQEGEVRKTSSSDTGSSPTFQRRQQGSRGS